MGAMIIAVVIMGVWARTIYSECCADNCNITELNIVAEFKQLCGIAAPAEYMNLVTYKVSLQSFPDLFSRCISHNHCPS